MNNFRPAGLLSVDLKLCANQRVNPLEGGFTMEQGTSQIGPAWLLFGLVGLGACAHAQAARTDQPVKPPEVAAPRAEASPTASTPTRAERDAADLQRMLDGTVLHFGFDEADLTAESKERLVAVAQAMKERSGLAVRVAGNCDERGTEEYNLALGERRASAAKKYLVNLGIDAGRIGTVSYGKERPAVDGHDERAWAQNRRDEIRPTRGL